MEKEIRKIKKKMRGINEMPNVMVRQAHHDFILSLSKDGNETPSSRRRA